MSTPSPDRIKNFLDEVMLVCLKHRIQICHELGFDCEWFELRELDQEAGGLLLNDYRELGSFQAGQELNWDERAGQAIRSIDVSTLPPPRSITPAEARAFSRS